MVGPGGTAVLKKLERWRPGGSINPAAGSWEAIPLDTPIPPGAGVFSRRIDAPASRLKAGASGGVAVHPTALFTGGFEGGSVFQTRIAVLIGPGPDEAHPLEVLPLQMVEPRNQHAVARMPNDRVLISGGTRAGAPFVTASAEIFSFLGLGGFVWVDL